MFQSRIYRFPIYIREERLDIFRPLGRFVIQQKRMLPNIHYQNRVEACHFTDLMQADPMIGESSGRRVFVTHSPADTTHLANTNIICLPDVVASEACLGGLEEC